MNVSDVSEHVRFVLKLGRTYITAIWFDTEVAIHVTL